MKDLRPILILTTTLAVAACAGGPFGNQGGKTQPPPPKPAPGEQGPPPAQPAPPPAQKPAPQPQQQEQEQPPPRSAEEASSPAVMSLIHNSDQLAQAGKMDAAAAMLERALGIAPRNSFIYQRLAAVRASQGKNGQAEQLAMKSNSLAHGNPFVESGNWKLIAAARRAAGNKQGAQQASAKADDFQRKTSQYTQ
jgi:tetratricopeptide (TPR) repeat protein